VAKAAVDVLETAVNARWWNGFPAVSAPFRARLSGGFAQAARLEGWGGAW